MTSFICKVEIILHMKVVFKQHIIQYIQCVSIYISNMLKFFLGGGKSMMPDVSLTFWVPLVFNKDLRF